MELTTDSTKFFTIICRDGMLQAPLSIVKSVKMFSEIHSHEDTFYTSDSTSRVNRLFSLLCDNNDKQNTGLIKDYGINTKDILDDSVYLNIQMANGIEYYSLITHIPDVGSHCIRIHPTYVTLKGIKKGRGYMEYQVGELVINKKYEIILRETDIEFPADTKAELDKSDMKILEIVRYFGSVDKMMSSLMRKSDYV